MIKTVIAFNLALTSNLSFGFESVKRAPVSFAQNTKPIERLKSFCQKKPQDPRMGFWSLSTKNTKDQEFKKLVPAFLIVLPPSQGNSGTFYYDVYMSNQADFSKFEFKSAKKHDLGSQSFFQIHFGGQNEPFYDLMVGFVSNKDRAWGYKNWNPDLYYNFQAVSVGCNSSN